MDAVIIVQIQYTYITAEFETGCSRTGDRMKWCNKGTCTLILIVTSSLAYGKP